MSNPDDDQSIIQTERRVLQALCQETPEVSLRESAQRLLADYRWREPIHQAIFDCLVNLPCDGPLAMRDQLPARVTRKGFPDVAWEEFFQPASLTKHGAEDLMRQLRDVS